MPLVWTAACRVWQIREARQCLLGLAFFHGLFIPLLVVLTTATAGGNFSFDEVLPIAAWILGGLALGSLLTAFQNHPRRKLGLVSFGSTGLAAGLVLFALGVVPSPGMNLFLGCMCGLLGSPLAETFQANLPVEARGTGIAFCNIAKATAIALLTGLIVVGIVIPAWQFRTMAGLAILAAVWAWRTFFRETVELGIEILLFPMYRIRAHGPGLASFPRDSPLIVVANHSAWLDPVWLAKVLPRRLIPMMTSVFYDLPVIRWLMVHVAQAIRVQASTFRREVPELKEAVAVLDRGECLVIFPEGAMRKRADRPVRQFGQGVWHILRERPSTPVVCCWIEGGWGSYFSYCNGLPTKNKAFDIRRRIDIAVTASQVLPADLLENQKTTRSFLMQACLEARAILGLEVPTLETAVDSKDEEETAAPEKES